MQEPGFLGVVERVGDQHIPDGAFEESLIDCLPPPFHDFSIA